MKRTQSILIVFASLLFACSPDGITTQFEPTPVLSQNIAPTDSPEAPDIAGKKLITRTILTSEELMGAFTAGSPREEEAFAMPSNTQQPKHSFEGRLELHDEQKTGDIQVHKGSQYVDNEVPHLPEFDFEFVQSDNNFIPTLRGLIITDHPTWNYILEPGHAWQEPGDGDYTRVSFPFALVWKGSNATFNGVMSFLFNDNEISKVWYQITQETTISMSADFWGLLEASYHPGPVSNRNQVLASFAAEQEAKFPTRPIEQLAEDYPGIDTSQFGRGVSSKHMTYYGFVFDGVNYLGGCPTRYGQYAYCESMRAPSYSTAKSVFPSLALMRLAQKYDPELAEALIKDYLPETEFSPGDWSEVTFDHTLDMATGNFNSAGYMEDEENFSSHPFWTEEYYTERISAALDWPNGDKPGEQWVYRTYDTFIVTRALHNYLQSEVGTEADIFQFLVDEVLIPVGIGPGAHTTLRTRDDNWQGQPYGGYGMWWIPDDIAKITTFLNVQNGQVEGEQILQPELLATALQKDPDDRGVDINANSKYNNAFWAHKYSSREGYDCEFWVPQMLGYSGIVIIMMPNGSAYYYASDNREFNWLEAVKESNKIAPHCQS